jgi:hydrogenase-4 membrane subunit HyfE
MPQNKKKDNEMPLINKILLGGLVIYALVFSYIRLGKEYPEGFMIAVLSIALGLVLGILLGKKIKSAIQNKK